MQTYNTLHYMYIDVYIYIYIYVYIYITLHACCADIFIDTQSIHTYEGVQKWGDHK